MNPSVGLSNSQVSYQNGWLRCSFRRLKSLDTLSQTRKTRASFVNNYFDLNMNYYLLAAFGRVFGGAMQQHEEKIASRSMLNFTSAFTSSGDSTSISKSKIKAHGE